MSENWFTQGNSTGAFRVAPSALTAVIGRRWLARWWPFLAALPLGFILYGSIADLRWVLVGITILFLILPPTLIFVLLSHALRPTARFSVARHTFTATSDGLLFRRIDPISPLRPRRQPIIMPLKPLRGAYSPEALLPYSRITAAEKMERFVILSLDGSPYKIILLPREEAEKLTDNKKEG